MKHRILVVLGPTASGKTRLACHLAHQLQGEIISADSRQIYKGMDIGTGKDLHEYAVEGKPIPYHLINICEAGERYNINKFAHDAADCLADIWQQEKQPILCGGSGLYLEAVLKGHPYSGIPVNEMLRKEVTGFGKEELQEKLRQLPEEVRAHADFNSTKRLIRALEVGHYLIKSPQPPSYPATPCLIFGTDLPREERRVRIEQRLRYRLENGLIEEVTNLIEKGLSYEMLDYYGLEYRWIGLYLQGILDRETLFERLKVGIQQFAKRQMTWFRKMEKDGFPIHWLDAQGPIESQVAEALEFWAEK